MRGSRFGGSVDRDGSEVGSIDEMWWVRRKER